MNKPRGKRHLPEWFEGMEETPMVVSSRARLARNFSDTFFPPKATEEMSLRLLDRLRHFFQDRQPDRFHFIYLPEQNETERGVLAERGLLPLNVVEQPRFVGLATHRKDPISVLINDEDHLRIQAYAPGRQLHKVLNLVLEMGQAIEDQLPIARHPQFGYLTACPTNVGTGLRASVMLHLPGLTLTHGMPQVLQALVHMGLAVRGIYGEATEAKTNYFQISNQVTLGRSEKEIITHLDGVINQIMEREAEARKRLLKEKRLYFEDRLGRAIGVLRGCSLLGFEEAMELLSVLRLAAEIGFIESGYKAVLSELFLLIQPFHLQQVTGEPLSHEAIQHHRAKITKNRLKKFK
jgi:protein arginine kinase